jgi:hypothetical protein
MNTETTYPFECSVCGKRTGIEARGRYAAIDKLEEKTDWLLFPSRSYFAKTYCPEHTHLAVETRER